MAPGAGLSNPPDVTRAAEAPVTRATTQPCVTDPPRLDLTSPQQVVTPPGHYPNPLDNMIAAASRLAALPVEGESPAVIEAWKAVELLQTAVADSEFIKLRATADVIAGALNRQRFPAASGAVTRPMGMTRCVMITMFRP